MTSHIVTLLLAASPIAAPRPDTPARRAPDPVAIAEVASGKRAEARASWWGFDPADSTAPLQAAIRSGARRLIVENLGAPWVVAPVELASDQEIVFEPGTVILAKRGAFLGTSDCLLSASCKSDITLVGRGATLRMWRADYDDPARYKRAEWRHALSFKSCQRVRVEGLTLAESGGDGIYLGVARRGVPCSDVVLRDVTCAGNYRQGISVISARDLLIERCTLRDTAGTAPQAGIDFEPNHESEELVNCVMRDCVSANNAGDAYTFYLRPLRASSRPVSIRIENCRALGSRTSARVSLANDAPDAAVTGSIEFVGCTFEGSLREAIAVGDKPASGARVAFERCAIVRPAADQPAVAPIVLSTRGDAVAPIAEVDFLDCTIEETRERVPITFHDGAGGIGIGRIGGALTLTRDGTSTRHELTPALLASWLPHSVFKRFPPAPLDLRRLEPALPAPDPSSARPARARQRGESLWVLLAQPGRDATFSVRLQPVGKSRPERATVSVTAPDGKTKRLQPATASDVSRYTISPAESGPHVIRCDPGNATATVDSPDHRVSIAPLRGSIHLLGSAGEYFFWVPRDTAEFGVRISGEGDGERVKATLVDPAGKIVEERDNIVGHQFLGRPADRATGAIWSLRISRPSIGILEDLHIRLEGIPPILAETRDDLLKPAEHP